MNRYGFTLCIYIILFLLLTAQVQANEDSGFGPKDNSESAQVPKALAPAFEHLLAYSDSNIPEKLNMDQVDQVINFINSDKDLKKTFSMGKRKGAASNYYEFSLNRPLKEVLDIVYNPEIPSHMTTPASIRRSEWVEINGKKQKLPKLSDQVKGLTTPVIIKGIEFIENTPDTYSGAYYAYELDRALLLIRHKGRTVLISISNQRDKSNVGKKGLVLGNDDNWDYLYTDEEGCSRIGLGWVESYMYHSASIAVYYETDGPNPKVRCGLFKWLKAGWANINMVKPHHIRDGVIRFAKPLKDIVESPLLGDTTQVTKALDKIRTMPEQELRQKVQRYYLHLKDLHQNQNRLAHRWFDQLSGETNPLSKMNTKELRALLEKAYVKHLLGKTPGIDIGLFTPASLTSRNSG